MPETLLASHLAAENPTNMLRHRARLAGMYIAFHFVRGDS